jgi:hypothetical protein
MRQQKEVTIKGNKYQITQFGGRQGIKLGRKVAKVVLPALAAAYKDSEQPNLADIMEVAVDHVDDLDDNTIMELLSLTTKNKFEIDFDNEFAGKYGVLLQLLWEIITFNFADFLDEAQGDTVR